MTLNLDTDQETWSVRFPHDVKFISLWDCGDWCLQSMPLWIFTIWTFRLICTHINCNCWLSDATEVRSLTTVGITHVIEVITVSSCRCPNKKYRNKRNPLSIWTYWNEIFANVRHLVIDFWAHKTRHRNYIGQSNLEKSIIKSFTRIIREIPSKIFSDILSNSNLF